MSRAERENYSILFSHLEGINLWYLLSLIHQENIVPKWHSAHEEPDECKTKGLEKDWLAGTPAGRWAARSPGGPAPIYL